MSPTIRIVDAAVRLIVPDEEGVDEDEARGTTPPV
jgi:hypothetical protein